MTMKAFKAALKAKLKFAEENCKTNDDYYLKWSCGHVHLSMETLKHILL